MKIRKAIVEIGFVFIMGMMTAGCAGTAKEEPQTEEREISLIDDVRGDSLLKDAGKEADGADTDESEKGWSVSASEGTEYLSGKVQSPQENGMTLAQTTLTDDDGMVTMLDVKDAKKIPVKFTADTKAEYWIIQGGGAGIDMKEASLSDLQEGMGVELEGYFEGETFVAVKVIIEEYV